MSSTNGIGSLQGASALVTPASPPAPADREQLKTVSATAASATKVGGAFDQASISSTSELLSAALSASDVRLEKVLPLQQSIANGTYHVASTDVAEKLITSLVK